MNLLSTSTPTLHLAASSFPINKIPNFLSSPLNQNHASKSNIIRIFSSISTSPSQLSSNLNGWDEFELLEHSGTSPELKFLEKFGLDDSKHAFTFLLGFVSALAVSRLRFSFMIVFPASILIFVGGYLMAVAKFRKFTEKVRSLEGFLVGQMDKGVLDRGMIDDLVKGMEGFKDNFDLGLFLNEHLGFELGDAKKKNVKSSKKRKEFDFVQYFGDLFGENVTGSYTKKVEDGVMDVFEQLNTTTKNVTKKFSSEKASEANSEVEQPEHMMDTASRNPKESYKYKTKTIHNMPKYRSPMNVSESRASKKSYDANDARFGDDMLSYEQCLNNSNRSSHYTSKREHYREKVFNQNYTLENMEFDGAESHASMTLEENIEMSDKSYSALTEESTYEASPIDDRFNQYIQEATDLIKQAKECMKNRVDEKTTSSILHKSAMLLSEVETVNPTSLLVVGQLGNTYLLHGELKLKLSKELRSMLHLNDTSPNRRSRYLNYKEMSNNELKRDDVEITLVQVCEECEELLIQAGRKYRRALSIDGDDVRALYNWGLALSFRAQLIADIGPEMALDADKIYLAAIDKFDAMMSRSNLYTTDALYRWGLVLQQRSYIHRHNSRNKTKLLHQAKSLFEDVLMMDSDNLPVRQALVSCISELNSNGRDNKDYIF